MDASQRTRCPQADTLTKLIWLIAYRRSVRIMFLLSRGASHETKSTIRTSDKCRGAPRALDQLPEKSNWSPESEIACINILNCVLVRHGQTWGRPKKQELKVNDSQTQELKRLVQQCRSHHALAFRAKIILHCASGMSNVAVAQQLKTTGFTVGFWRQRFIAAGVEGLFDEPRPGAPRKIGDENVERVVQLTLESSPKGAAHWSTRGLAEKTGLSQSVISRIWRAFGLQPHRSQTFLLSSDPFLVAKVRDIVGLYMNPPDHELVLCVDEKSQIQALNRTHPILAMQPG